MNLFDNMIQQTRSILQGHSSSCWAYNPGRSWKTCTENQLVLLRDASIELGANGLDAAAFTMVTTDDSIIQRDEIRLIGDDLPHISQDTAFAKIILIQAKQLAEDETEAYKQIKDIDFLKYKFYLDGYMSRISNERCREHVRIGKNAHAGGITFEQVGNSIINRYKSHPLVERVQVWFVTKPIPEFQQLSDTAQKNKKITSALNHIMDDLNFDCNTCNLREVCAEVEGLRDYHRRVSGVK